MIWNRVAKKHGFAEPTLFLFDETKVLDNVLGCFVWHPVPIHKSLDAVKLMVVVVVGQLGVMEEGRDVGNNRG